MIAHRLRGHPCAVIHPVNPVNPVNPVSNLPVVFFDGMEAAK
jgi:hypothetical protein